MGTSFSFISPYLLAFFSLMLTESNYLLFASLWCLSSSQKFFFISAIQLCYDTKLPSVSWGHTPSIECHANLFWLSNLIADGTVATTEAKITLDKFLLVHLVKKKSIYLWEFQADDRSKINSLASCFLKCYEIEINLSLICLLCPVDRLTSGIMHGQQRHSLGYRRRHCSHLRRHLLQVPGKDLEKPKWMINYLLERISPKLMNWNPEVVWILCETRSYKGDWLHESLDSLVWYLIYSIWNTF